MAVIELNEANFENEVEKNKAIVMDNATFHCKSRLYELCKNANKNLKLIFLPFTLFTIFFYFYSKKKITNVFLTSFIANILGTAATTISF